MGDMSMDPRTYLDESQVIAHLEDAVVKLIQKKGEAGRPLEFIASCLSQVQQGKHIVGREFAFLNVSRYNLESFSLILRDTFRGFPPDTLLKPHDCHQMVTLLCPDFPFNIILEVFELTLASEGRDTHSDTDGDVRLSSSIDLSQCKLCAAFEESGTGHKKFSKCWNLHSITWASFEKSLKAYLPRVAFVSLLRECLLSLAPSLTDPSSRRAPFFTVLRQRVSAAGDDVKQFDDLVDKMQQKAATEKIDFLKLGMMEILYENNNSIGDIWQLVCDIL